MIEESLYRQLQTEFLDSTDDCAERIEALADKALRGGGDSKAALKEIRREAHTLKGMGGSFGYPLVSTIAHKLEDYLADEKELTAEVAHTIGVFLDRVREIARKGQEPSGPEATTLLRALPSRRPPPEISVNVVDVEVLLGVPSTVTAKIVRDILQNCGFRVLQATSMLDCFTLTFRAKPNAVIFSQTLDELSGADLARALGAMTSTGAIPAAVLTSFNLDHAALKSLPDSVSIIRLGKEHFDGDMANFLSRIDIGAS